MDSVKQGRLKTLSTIVSVLSKIGKIFCFIGIAGLIIFAVVSSFIAKGINFKKHEIKIADQVIKYEIKDDDLTVYLNGEEQDIDFKVTGLNDVSKKLEEFTSTKITTACLVFAGGEILILIVMAIFLGKISKLFKNISKEDTPFTSDNTVLIHEIANNLVVLFIIPIVLSAALNLIVKFDINLNISFTSITLILVTYVASIIFEYGTMLQEKSKQTIYGTK